MLYCWRCPANTFHAYGGMVWGSGTVVSFQTSAGTVTIGRDVQHPSYPTDNDYDIGPARLTSPIRTITPVKLYDLS